MILAFEFQYLSNNGVLESFLKNIADESKLTYKIKRDENIVSLFVEDDENELIKFSDTISSKLPLSIFFKSSNVKVVEEFPQNIEIIKDCDIEIPFTPTMLNRLLDESSNDFYNPFISPEIGKKVDASIPLTLDLENEHFKASNSMEFVQIFQQIAKELKNGKALHVQTATGCFNLGVINEASKELLNKASFCVMPCDLSLVEKMVVIKENEIKALASLEKPTLNLRLNMIYKAKELLPDDFVNLRLADDLILYLICKELFKLGEEFVYLSDDISNVEGKVSFQGKETNRKQIGVSVLENGEILPIFGTSYASDTLKNNIKKFDSPSHAQYAAIMQEHKLFDKNSCCFYLSKRNDDKIMSYSQENGMLDFIDVKIPSSIDEMIKMIKASNQSAPKLIENYFKAYPNICEKLSNIKISKDSPNNFYTMFGIVGVIFGFADDVDSAAKKLLNNAEIYGGKKGPRIDYLLLDESLRSSVDIVKLVKSGISFRLAGTDDMTISFGYLESLSYFISDMADSFEENLSTNHIGLCGSMFNSKRFSELSAKNIQPNHKVCFNRELPMDS